MARILLAEDDGSMRQFLTLALEKAGHETVQAKDGVHALQILEQDQDFALLLTDIVMPGIDGIELSQMATSACPNLKVMFITGFAAVAVGHTDPVQDNTKILSKPFHLNDLVGQVDALLKNAA